MLLKITGLLIGGIAGFLYYKFIGCQSGVCPLTSNPYSSTVFGSLIGFFTISTFIS